MSLLQGQTWRCNEPHVNGVQISVGQLQRGPFGQAVEGTQAKALAVVLQGAAQALPAGQGGAAAPAEAGVI